MVNVWFARVVFNGVKKGEVVFQNFILGCVDTPLHLPHAYVPMVGNENLNKISDAYLTMHVLFLVAKKAALQSVRKN